MYIIKEPKSPHVAQCTIKENISIPKTKTKDKTEAFQIKNVHNFRLSDVKNLFGDLY